MRIDPKLKKFLREKGVLQAFKTEVTRKTQHQFSSLYVHESITGSLCWTLTAQGKGFWSELHTEFTGDF
mgnify:CR=1 FL=1